MSKQEYEQILAEFREAWCRHGGELFNVRIFAPSGIMMGFGPSFDKPPYDLEKYDLIAEVALPLDSSREVTPDGENSTPHGFAVSEREYRTEEALETFKRLCGEAGAALPPEFRDRVAGLCPWEMRKPATWWLALLVTLTGDSARLPNGRYLGEVVWVRPFLLCIEAIERCRLNTDNPEFPEGNTGVSASGAVEDGPVAGGPVGSLEETDRSNDSKRIENGPGPNGLFYHSGESYDVSQRNYEILEFLWPFLDGDPVPFCDLGEAVWGQDNTKTSTIKSTLSRLSTWLSDTGLPYEISSSRERVFFRKTSAAN